MTYPGGKNGAGVYQQIINQIPPHETYISPFLGHDAVLLHKRLARANIGVDCDAAVVEWWSSMLAESGEAHDRLPGTIVIKGDGISFLKNYDWKGNEFIYCDPPYLFETRSSKRAIYKHEFGDAGQHEKLLRLLISIPCAIAISGYWSSLYAAILPEWRTISYTTRTRGGSMVREWLWMNYPEPVQLHDYKFLGNNFRERERVTRIKRRWIEKMNRLSPLERFALLSAFDDYRSGIDEKSDVSCRPH